MTTDQTGNIAELLTPQMVCELIPGQTVTSLAQLRYSGKGAKFVKLGKRVYYRRSDIAEWINSNVQTISGMSA